LFPSQYRGGAEEYAFTIASAARKRLGWRVYAAFPKTPATATLIDDLQENGVQYIPLNIREFPDYHQETWGRHAQRFVQTAALLRSINPDRVVLSLPWPPQGFSSLMACAVFHIPTVVVFQLMPQPFAFGPKRLRLYQWARTRSQQWVGVSRYNCRLIAQTFQIPEREVRCVYNGVAAAEEPPSNRSAIRHQVRAEFGLPATAPLVVTVGRLHHQKGHDTIIPAIPHIVREFPDLKFIWVGEGPEQQPLRQKLDDYGVTEAVIFTGYRQDVGRCLQAADIFLFPTRFEGFPFAVLEAMAQGAPVVSSRSTSIPEVIEHQVHGLLFRPEDSCDLLETLRGALRSPETMRLMAQRAMQRVRAFSQQAMLDHTLSILQHLE